MFVVTGANGQTGSAAMRHLLAGGHRVRGVVRREEQCAAWREAGAEVVVADLGNGRAMAACFDQAQGAYLMNPPAYAEPDLFEHAARVHTALISAAEVAGVAHVVALSSVGAQHDRYTGNILTTHDLEVRLAASSLRATVLRAANFIENWAWSLDALVSGDALPSMFAPVERALPMVSALDIGRVAAELLIAGSAAPPLVELHGPQDSSPNDAAAVLARLLGRPISALATPEAEWPTKFRASGFSDSAITAFCDMYRAFNNGRVAFSGDGITEHGVIGLDVVLDALPSRDRRYQ